MADKRFRESVHFDHASSFMISALDGYSLHGKIGEVIGSLLDLFLLH